MLRLAEQKLASANVRIRRKYMLCHQSYTKKAEAGNDRLINLLLELSTPLLWLRAAMPCEDNAFAGGAFEAGRHRSSRATAGQSYPTPSVERTSLCTWPGSRLRSPTLLLRYPQKNDQLYTRCRGEARATGSAMCHAVFVVDLEASVRADLSGGIAKLSSVSCGSGDGAPAADVVSLIIRQAFPLADSRPPCADIIPYLLLEGLGGVPQQPTVPMVVIVACEALACPTQRGAFLPAIFNRNFPPAVHINLVKGLAIACKAVTVADERKRQLPHSHVAVGIAQRTAVVG